MTRMTGMLRNAKLAVALLAGLALAACASSATQNQAGMAAAGAPGSQQDFVVNVGDRVFFETDSTELTPQARGTLDKQAQWLQAYTIISPRTASTPTGCARSPTARNVRSRCATIFPAGRRTGGPSPCSTRARSLARQPGACIWLVRALPPPAQARPRIISDKWVEDFSVGEQSQIVRGHPGRNRGFAVLRNESEKQGQFRILRFRLDGNRGRRG